MKEDEGGAVLGVIPARGGSKRVPRKNIRKLGEKPLIAWTIEQANLASSLDYFVVSTEDEEIRSISNDVLDFVGAFNTHRGKVLRRPEHIADDCDTTLVLQHAVEYFEYKTKRRVGYVVCLQPTSPFRNYHDIDECVHIAQQKKADTVISVRKVTEHPYWCFESDIFGNLKPFMDIRMEGDNLISQNLPLVWFPNGAVYVINRKTLDSGKIFGRRILSYRMPHERSIDLEEELDFFVASSIIKCYGEDHHVKMLPKLVVGCSDD